MARTRIQKLLKNLPDDFEAALIQTQSNRFYFLDFDTDDAGTLLILPEACYFFVDSRYIESAQQNVEAAEVVLQKELYAQIKKLLLQADVGKIYLENQISLEQYARLKEQLPDFSFDATKTLSDVIYRLRAVKDEEEKNRIRKAQAITDACLEHILNHIVPGAKEVDLMLEMEHFLRRNGALQVAFDTIFLSGVNTSLPHGRPSNKSLEYGDFITMDFGAKYRGYCSDMTRTVALGKPSAWQQEVYEVVQNAQREASQSLRSGLVCSEVDKVARDIIQKAGYAENFGHGLGHAVGIDIHEQPRLSPLCSETLLENMVVTVEPGIYLAGQFGCRIEDTVIVKENGCEIPGRCPKELLIL